MLRLLFVCSRNRWRSPTAEQVFAARSGVECASAGLTNDAEVPVTLELLDWADLIFVMEPKHKVKLRSRFKAHTSGKRIVSLGIPDKYKYMEPRLVVILEAKVGPYLPSCRSTGRAAVGCLSREALQVYPPPRTQAPHRVTPVGFLTVRQDKRR